MVAAGCQIADSASRSDINSKPVATPASPNAPTGRTPQRSHSHPPTGDDTMLLLDRAASINPSVMGPRPSESVM